jgi:hypothetical protein
MTQSRNASRNRSLFLASLLALFLLLIAETALEGSKKEAASSATQAADSFQLKIDYIKANAAKNPPDSKPTIVTEAEVNAYFAQRRLKMPDGVKTVVMEMAPGQVTARTHVDFTEIRREKQSMNPLLAVFDGEHDAVVVASTEVTGPETVRVHVESVTIDDVPVPKMAMEYFVKKYVQPKYPNVSLDGEYHLPARMDSVTIGDKQGTVIQK